MAGRQCGIIATHQLISLGLSRGAIRRLADRGFLIRLHPSIYAVGYRPRGIDPRLHTALLLGGDRAALSYQAGALVRGFTDRVPAVVEVRAPTRRLSRPGFVFHRDPDCERELIRGFAVAPPAVTLVDYAARATPWLLRRAVAGADRLGQLDRQALSNAVRRGRPGSSALRAALGEYMPELASTLSELEDRFLELVAAAGLPLPEVNVTVGGLMVDCLFLEAGLVVELDGHRYHANPAASEEDRDREMRLRELGYRVVRYTWQQVTTTPTAVLADLARELRSPG